MVILTTYTEAALVAVMDSRRPTQTTRGHDRSNDWRTRRASECPDQRCRRSRRCRRCARAAPAPKRGLPGSQSRWRVRGATEAGSHGCGSRRARTAGTGARAAKGFEGSPWIEAVTYSSAVEVLRRCWAIDSRRSSGRAVEDVSGRRSVSWRRRRQPVACNRQGNRACHCIIRGSPKEPETASGRVPRLDNDACRLSSSTLPLASAPHVLRVPPAPDSCLTLPIATDRTMADLRPAPVESIHPVALQVEPAPVAAPTHDNTLNVPSIRVDRTASVDDQRQPRSTTPVDAGLSVSQTPSRAASPNPHSIYPHTQITYDDPDFLRPPPLNYSLRPRTKAIFWFWFLIMVDCIFMPIGLYFGMWYGLTRKQLSANAVFSISTGLLGTVSIVEYFIRFHRLWKKNSRCRVLGAKRYYLDWFHWNLSVGWFFVMIELIVYVLLSLSSAQQD